MFVVKLTIFTLTCLLGQLATAELPILHPSCNEYEDAFFPTQLPYPNDCTKFYKCSGGFAFPMSCPRGLHWSPTANRCEYPLVARCDSSIVVPNPPTGGTQTGAPPRVNGDAIETSACPIAEDPSNPTQLPYPGNCNMFYKCEAGFAYPVSCPRGLHWSTTLNRCEWPIQANCAWSSLPTPAPQTPAPQTPAPQTPAPQTPAPQTPAPQTPAPQTPAPQTPAPQTPAPQTPAPQTPAPQTPAPQTPAPQTPAPQTPAPQTPAPQTPAPQTPAPQTPAPQTPAPQTPAPQTPAPETPAPQTPAPITPPPSPTDLNDLDAYCRARVTKSGYLSYPGDCKRFIQCSNGRGYVQSCPGTLQFNSKVLACARYCA